MRAPLEVPISMDPDPVIEAYKKDVDRTLIRHCLEMSVAERIQSLQSMYAVYELGQKRRRETRGT